MQRITRVAALALVALAIVLAIVAFGLSRRAAKPASDLASGSRSTATKNASPQQGFAVVVAAARLRQGAPISTSALRVVKQPQQPKGSLSDAQALAGSVPRIDIPAGAIVTSALLVQGMATVLKPGERALAVPVDEQAGVGNRVQPGDYVDVFLSLKPPPSANFGNGPVDGTQTRLLLSHLRVLAYGDQDLPLPQEIAVDTDGENAKLVASRGTQKALSSSRESPPPAPRTAVLAVPVEEADRLLLGVQNGRLSLALRPAGDESQPDSRLFEEPHGVLATRANITAEQQHALAQAENRAYAGIGGPGLAGQDASTPRSQPNRHNERARNLEIIRGYPSDSLRGARKDLP